MYLHFTSRAELVAALFRHVADTEGLEASTERVWRAPNASAALDEWARHLARYHPRVLEVTRAVERVRHVDADAAEHRAQVVAAQLANCRRLAEWLRDEGRLAKGWTVETATDMLWALISTDMIEALLVDRRWSRERLGGPAGAAVPVDVQRRTAHPPMTPGTGLATATTPTPAHVVRAYLVISGLFTLAASVIWGVNTLFLLDAGLDIFEVFVANAAFTAGMVIFEIPTGVVADTGGRRRSFLLSTVVAELGTLGVRRHRGIRRWPAAVRRRVGRARPRLRASTRGRSRRGWSTHSRPPATTVCSIVCSPARHDGLWCGRDRRISRRWAAGHDRSGMAVRRAGRLLMAVFVVGLFTMHDVGFTPRTAICRRCPPR